MKSNVLTDSTVGRIENWSRWSKNEPELRKLYWPSSSPTSKGYVTPNIYDTPDLNYIPITDRDAQGVESAWRQLGGRDMNSAMIVKWRWVYRWSGRTLAKELGTNRTDVWRKIDNAELLFQGVLWASNDDIY